MNTRQPNRFHSLSVFVFFSVFGTNLIYSKVDLNGITVSVNQLNMNKKRLQEPKTLSVNLETAL